jgi:hypothetical protein
MLRIREFDEEADNDRGKMRMIAVWEGQETMLRGVSDRDNPSGLFAQAAMRRDTARTSMNQR